MILVTGAAGLLGREVVAQLGGRGERTRWLELRAAGRDRSTQFTVGDLLDPSTCRSACEGVRAIVHSAARQHHSHPPRWGRTRFFDANVDMTRNLVDAALSAGVGHL